MADISLGKKIKEKRLELRITQKELAGEVITRNMLSQIENDLAMPSIKTLEHIANMLGKSVSYFIGDIKNNEKKSENNILGDFIKLYDKGKYDESIRIIEGYFEENPKQINTDILKSIYINCCIKNAVICEKNKQYKEAKENYLKILDFNIGYMDMQDISIFTIYSKLSEVSSLLEDYESSIKYEIMADDLVDKLRLDRCLQKIYHNYLLNNYDKVIKELQTVNVDDLTDTNKGKYFLMMGSSLYNKKKFLLAINYLEKAVNYYDNKSTIIRQVIYKELSGCCSEIDDYKKAYEYLQLSQKNYE